VIVEAKQVESVPVGTIAEEKKMQKDGLMEEGKTPCRSPSVSTEGKVSVGTAILGPGSAPNANGPQNIGREREGV